MVRYTGNDDPTDAEGFNGLRTKDKIIRKTHMGTQSTHQTIFKKRIRNPFVFQLTLFEQ